MNQKLTLWELVLFGILCITPIAPIPPFGIIQHLSNGHAALTILIGMFAMLPTAISYGHMAALYPSAGSAYTFVSRGLHRNLGFLAGWATCLDYLVIPIINVIYCAVTMQRLLPAVPYIAWVLGFAGLSTWLNLRGVRSGVRTNQALLFIMTTILAAFIALATRYLLNTGGGAALVSTLPFYNPQTFNFDQLRTATSFAALTYIGFDAISTLAEEAQNPRRNIALATVLVCLIIGVSSCLIVYLAQLVWPNYSTFKDLDTAFMDVSARVGGVYLFQAVAILLILGQFGCAVVGQTGAGRLLFGMGRDGVLPRGLFAFRDEVKQVPTYNILLIGAVTIVGAMLLDFERGAELLNFGAFLAYMGVNLAVIKSHIKNHKGSLGALMLNLLLPSFGFVLCLGFWVSLPEAAKRVGCSWLLLGFIYQLIITRGFRRSVSME